MFPSRIWHGEYWTDVFMATGAGTYGAGIIPAKDIELLSIAFDASYTHMYAPSHDRAASAR